MIKEDTNGKRKKKVKTENSYVEKNMETQNNPHWFYVSPPSFFLPGSFGLDLPTYAMRPRCWRPSAISRIYV